jgi:hypothetical protein
LPVLSLLRSVLWASPKKIGEDIAKETTMDWKGLLVTVTIQKQRKREELRKVIDVSVSMFERTHCCFGSAPPHCHIS